MADFEWDSREAFPIALETIHKYFKVAFLDDNYFNSVASVLTEHGFQRDNNIALVNTCRDELARPISHFFDKTYGHTFNLSGIASIITADGLGFYAATSHALTKPNERAKYIFFGSTHTAIDENGKEGAIRREGQTNEGNACEAIEAIKGEIIRGVVQTGAIRDIDVKYDILKKKIFSHDPTPSKTPTNFEITKIAIDVITADLENYIKTLDTTNADYVVFTSVQIHIGLKGGNPGSHLDYIAPVESYVVIDGSKHPVKTDAKKFVVEK